MLRVRVTVCVIILLFSQPIVWAIQWGAVWPPCKVIQDILGFWIPDTGFRFPIVSGILDSKDQDSWFHKKKNVWIPDSIGEISGFQNPYCLTWGDSVMKTSNNQWPNKDCITLLWVETTIARKLKSTGVKGDTKPLCFSPTIFICPYLYGITEDTIAKLIESWNRH